jgi:dienelactone hydrolase
VDYFFGDAINKHPDPDFDRQAWIETARGRAAAETPKWIQAVREHYGTEKKYVAVGYCFGGPYALNMGGTNQVEAGERENPVPGQHELTFFPQPPSLILRF